MQTAPQKKQSTASEKTLQKPVKKPNKPEPKSLETSQNKVLSNRLPKGSDDQIQQQNRFQNLNEDMEAEDSHAESIPNKQGRIIKLQWIVPYFQWSALSFFF